MIKEQRREEQRKKRKRKRRFIGFFLVLLLFGMGFLLVTRVYTVTKVHVVGNELYTDEQIEALVLEDEYSWSTLYVYLKNRFFPAEKQPFIDTMNVTMSLMAPHELRVEVYEKGMLGYLYIPSIDQNAYFDKDGFVVETSQEVRGEFPEIIGLTCDSVVLYEKLPIEDAGALQNLLALTQLLQKYDISTRKIKYDEVTKSMTAYCDKIEIRVGNADNLTQKIMRLQFILPQLEGKKGVLHLENWTSETTDIVFDPKKNKKSK